MQMCERKNSQQKCQLYYSGVIASKAKIFYKFGVSVRVVDVNLSNNK